jgi:hypothetical protein
MRCGSIAKRDAQADSMKRLNMFKKMKIILKIFLMADAKQENRWL